MTVSSGRAGGRIPRWAIISLAATVGLVGAGVTALALVPLFVDSDGLRKPLEEAIAQTLRRRVRLGKLQVQTLGGIGLRADRVELFNLRGSEKQLDARSVFVEVDLWPLLSRQVVLKRLEFERLDLALQRNPAGQWNVADLLTAQGPDGPGQTGYSGPAVSLVDSTVRVTDQTQNPPRQLRLSNVAFDLRPQNPYDLDITFKGDLGEKTPLAVAGTIELPKGDPAAAWGGELRLQTQQLAADQVVGLLGQPALAGLKGLFDLDVRWELSQDQLEGKVKAQALAWLWPEVWGKTAWKARSVDLDGDLTFGPQQVAVERLQLKLPELTADAKGTLPRFFNQPGQALDLNVKTGEFDPFTARRSLPVAALPTSLLPWIAQSTGSGKIATDLAILGTVAQPLVTGRVDLKGLTLRNPRLPQPLESLNGTVLLGANRVQFQALKGSIGPSPFELTGAIDGYRTGKTQPQLIFKSPSLDLGVARSILTSELVASRALDNVTSLGGRAAVDLRIRGAQPEGRVEFQGARVGLSGLKKPVEDLRGTVQLGPQGNRFENLSGRLAGSDIRVGGSLGPTGALQVAGTGTLNFPQVFALLGSPPPIQAKGAVPMEFTAGGTTNKLDFTGNLDLAKLDELKFNNLNLTPAQRLVLRGTYTPAQLTFANTRLALAGLVLDGGGTVRQPGTPAQSLDLRARTPQPLNLTNITKLVPQVADLGVSAGRAGLDLSLKGPASSAAFQAALKLQGVAIPGLLGGISGLSGPVNVAGDQASTPGLTFQTPEGRGQLKGTVRNFKDPNFTFDARLARLNIDRLLASASGGDKKEGSSGGADLNSLRGQGQLAIDQGVVSRLTFQQLRTKVQLNRGVLVLNDFGLNTAGGRMGGDLRTDLKTQAVQGNLNLRDAEANTLARQLIDFPPNQIFGRTDMDFTFQAKGGNQNQFLQSLNGQGSMNVTNGRLATLNLMGPILGVAEGLGSGQGFSLDTLLLSVGRLNTGKFQRLGGNFRVQNGVARTDNFVYTGSALNMQADGTLRLVDEVANLQVRGSFTQNPLGAVSMDGDRLLGNLLGRILKLPQQQPRNFSFQVRGPINQLGSVRNVRLQPGRG
ncbi:AsmA family protein [Gloeobacter violaceus]|uniref:Glr0237 protein n=1 Tax=Gloeobacter violaceus (strain ATCC 29082 / PCC 7421) TaxID=251221 RepID=Q7NP21_GLOVI|nr:AsmA-like C-terminal region-containing protein [Gloeobacter violaceus]BAC88178.1 glr0237 [Gloeobacter violaceus PCC 7421]